MMGQSAALPRPAGLPGVSAVAPQAAAQAAPQGDAEPGTAPADAASFDLLLGLDLAASTSGEPGQPATPGTTKFRPAGTRLPPSEAATADAPLLPALAHLPPSLSPTPIPVAVPPQPAAAPVVTTTAGGVTSTGAAASPQPAVPAAAAPMQGVVPAIAAPATPAPATPAPATTAPVATAPVTTAPETTTTAFGFPAGSPAVPDIDADAIGPANAAPSPVTADTAPPLFATALAFAADAGARGNAAATPDNEFASTVAAISEALGVTAAPHAGPSASEPPPHALLATGTPPPPAVPLTHGLLPATPVMQAAVTAAPVLAQPADPSAGYDDRFANHVSMLAGQRITQATIRVSPEHMGTIDIRLQVDGTQVRAEFHSARADVRQTLEASLPRLRDMLDQHGLQLAHAGVGQGRGQGQGQPQGHTHPTQPAGHDEAGILVLPGQAPSPLPPDFRHPHRLLDVYA